MVDATSEPSIYSICNWLINIILKHCIFINIEGTILAKIANWQISQYLSVYPHSLHHCPAGKDKGPTACRVKDNTGKITGLQCYFRWTTTSLQSPGTYNVLSTAYLKYSAGLIVKPSVAPYPAADQAAATLLEQAAQIQTTGYELPAVRGRSAQLLLILD